MEVGGASRRGGGSFHTKKYYSFHLSLYLMLYTHISLSPALGTLSLYLYLNGISLQGHRRFKINSGGRGR